MTKEQTIKLLVEFFLDSFAEDAGDVLNWWEQGDLETDALNNFYEAVTALKNEQ